MAESTPALFDVKTCSKCGQVKALDAMVKNQGYCKSCRNARQRERYRNDPQFRERATQARERWERRHPNHRVAYYERTREYQLARIVQYTKRNPEYAERGKRRLAEWRAANPERDRDRTRAWWEANPDAVREIRRRGAARRRARKRGLPFEPYTLAQIIERDGVTCVLCGEDLALDARYPEPRAVTVEHLECMSWPDSAGDVLANVGAAHLGCNASRGNRPHPAAANKRAELLLANADKEATS